MLNTIRNLEIDPWKIKSTSLSPCPVVWTQRPSFGGKNTPTSVVQRKKKRTVCLRTKSEKKKKFCNVTLPQFNESSRWLELFTRFLVVKYIIVPCVLCSALFFTRVWVCGVCMSTMLIFYDMLCLSFLLCGRLGTPIKFRLIWQFYGHSQKTKWIRK